MKDEPTIERLRQIASELIGGSADEIPCDLPLRQIGFDSLDEVELVMAVEDMFDVEIPDVEAEKVSTLNDVLLLLARHGIQIKLPAVYERALGTFGTEEFED